MSKFARMRLRLKLWRISGTKLTVGLLLFISGAFLVYKLSGDKDISEGDTAVHPYHLPKHDPILPNELDRRLPNRPPRKFTAEDERKLLEFEAKMVPGLGEHGKAVELTGDEKTLADTIHAKEAFNLIASDKISLTRSVPDNRHKDCAKIEYDSVLPTASVIIIFTNEALSPLLRTIHSVLSKSPAQFLHEIVLVDDASDREELGSLLELYIERRLPSEKIKLHRLPSRHGLIRARLEGARIASGDVLVYLDSHCECGEDWLRPLLQRIKQNRRAVVVPIIEVINDRNMQYYTSTSGRFMESVVSLLLDLPSYVTFEVVVSVKLFRKHQVRRGIKDASSLFGLVFWKLQNCTAHILDDKLILR